MRIWRGAEHGEILITKQNLFTKNAIVRFLIYK